MRFYGKSSRGMVRGNNEDFFHVPLKEDDARFFIVADGMGGVNAGEVASSLAVASAVTFVEENYTSACDVALLLRQALNHANKAVFNTAKADKTYENMGTTLVCALIRDNLMFVANVGDSRCYKLSGEAFEQVSIDHSFVQEMIDKGMLSRDEANNHPNKNLITRAIGVDRFVRVDVFCKPFNKGDRILLTSDGLTTMVKSEEIEAIIKKEESCENIVRELIDKANEAGGRDNITAVLIVND